MMLHMTDDSYGNPGSIHIAADDPKNTVQHARECVARFLNGHMSDIVFTSGGSEGNSLIICGVIPYLRAAGKTEIIVSAAEHDSVLNAAYSAANNGFDVTVLPVNSEGCVEQNVLSGAITDKTGLVSVMYVNNELGGVNDAVSLAEICREKHVLFHTDCVQAAGSIPIDVTQIGCDFATISAHKFHGPKGVGAIYMRRHDVLSPIIFGGSAQEFGLRGGTENVPGIDGMGVACDIASLEMREDMMHIEAIKQRFFTELKFGLSAAGLIDGVIVNGPPVIHPGKILNLQFPGVDSETLLLALSNEGICVSSGSACNSHSSLPSHVLLAAGLSESEARSSIRISFSKYNTEHEAVYAGSSIARCVAALRCAR
jgi:cysteine desulfurase